MLKKLGMVDFIKAVTKVIEEGTGKRCYDAVPNNKPSPLYFAEIVELRPDNTKTMFVDVYTVMVHSIAEASESSVGIYQLIQDLEEALTKDIDVGCEYTLLSQSSLGLQNIQTDETGEKHGVTAYEFSICYGFKVK